MPQAAKKYYVVSSSDYHVCILLYIHVYVCRETHVHGIGSLLANTVHCTLPEVRRHGKRVASPQLTTPSQRGVTGKLSRQLPGILVNLAFLRARS